MQPHTCTAMSSAGLTMAAIRFWAPRGPLCEICSSRYARVDVRIKMREENSQKRGPKFYTCYTETLFVETKVIFSFCLGICFCVKVHFTWYIV